MILLNANQRRADLTFFFVQFFSKTFIIFCIRLQLSFDFFSLAVFSGTCCSGKQIRYSFFFSMKYMRTQITSCPIDQLSQHLTYELHIMLGYINDNCLICTFLTFLLHNTELHHLRTEKHTGELCGIVTFSQFNFHKRTDNPSLTDWIFCH